MEIKIVNLPFDVNTKTILIAKVSEDNKPSVNEFITNYSVEHRDCLDDKLYICYQLCDGIMQILGIFSFKENKPPIDNVGDDINCNELSYLILDLHILKFECLLHAFSIILPMLVNKNDNNDEGIWFAYRGLLYPRKIDKLFKTCKEYYFQNESEYFASKIVEIKEQTDDNVQKINSLLNR